MKKITLLLSFVVLIAGNISAVAQENTTNPILYSQANVSTYTKLGSKIDKAVSMPFTVKAGEETYTFVHEDHRIVCLCSKAGAQQFEFYLTPTGKKGRAGIQVFYYKNHADVPQAQVTEKAKMILQKAINT